MADTDVLTDGTIALRPFATDDAVPAYAAIQESTLEITPWLPDLSAIVSLSQVQTWIATTIGAREDGSAYHFAIVAARDGGFIGGCGLTQISRQHRLANLYYWVRTSRVGAGAATATTRLLARYGLETLHLQRVEISMAVDNLASRRVAEKAGAQYEGRLRNGIRLHGVVHDAFLFSLIPGDLGL
jgi:ribosomal-protein-serine acetyltransferase